MIARKTAFALGVVTLAAWPAVAQTTSPSTTVPSTQNPTTTNPSMQGTTPGTTPRTGQTDTTGSIGATGTTGGLFYSGQIGANHWRASDLIGQSVYNRADERIGEVNELVLDRDGRVSAAIIGVGGFLGVGERNVAVNFSAMQVSQDGNSMRVRIDTDRNRLQSAPEFRRPNTWTTN